MTAPIVKGYCPGALQPMMSGDGLVVRIRPFNGTLSAAQITGIADLSERFGNGILDLSSRANVQLRGVTAESHAPLIDGLHALGLIDASEAIESRRNIIVTPFRNAETNALAERLTTALCQPDAPALPHKFGFAIDTGKTPVLQTAPADIRLERASDGTLLLAAEGLPQAKPVTPDESIEEALALAHWFMANRTTQTRLAKLPNLDSLIGFTTPRQTQTYAPQPGATQSGTLIGSAFGQLTAETFAQLATLAPLHITPWRMVFTQSQNPIPGTLITDPANPLLRITACTGAPACTQAQGDTRQTARRVAPHLKPGQTLHISGCTKGCAHPKPAPLTLIATPNGFDLVKDGRAGDTPAAQALSTNDILKAL